MLARSGLNNGDGYCRPRAEQAWQRNDDEGAGGSELEKRESEQQMASLEAEVSLIKQR